MGVKSQQEEANTSKFKPEADAIYFSLLAQYVLPLECRTVRDAADLVLGHGG